MNSSNQQHTDMGNWDSLLIQLLLLRTSILLPLMLFKYSSVTMSERSATTNIWSNLRKTQNLDLVQGYGNEEIMHFVGMLNGLAFLPLADVKTGMEVLKSATLERPEELVHYFDSTCASESIRRVHITE